MMDTYIYGSYFLAYLIGSIPFGLILAKLFGYGDIRKIGSGNIGATNVLRTGNKKLAALTLILDAAKGPLAIGFVLLIPLNLSPCEAVDCVQGIKCPCFGEGGYNFWELYFMPGLFAIIGHCYPIWLKFKGGKGVATTLGVLLAAVPFSGMLTCLTWLISAKAGKISSLAAISAMICAPAYTYALYGLYPALINVLISLLVIWRHRENIARIRKGIEPKIGDKKKEEAANNAP